MKSLSHRLNARHLIVLGIAIPALLLVLVDWLQWQSVREYRAALEWVAHTRVVLLNLESFLTCMNDAETGQRGYLLTHKEDYLEPYAGAITRTPNELQTLRQLTSDNPVQQKNLDRLEPLVNAKFAELGADRGLGEKSGS